MMLVAVVIFWPESVTYWLDKEQKVNVDDVKIEMQIEDTSAPDPAASETSGASAVDAGDDALSVPMPEVTPEDDPTKAVKDAISAK